ncbi:hypothetical protein IPP75_02775 [Candidatus Saccharibacteria bacterium]|nr:MAG: hypothetical protein IPP75_02775 [Candidatus Saccharibacteria bacterium]
MGRTPEQVGTELHGLEQRATDPAERWKPSLRDALRSLRIEQSTLLGVGDGEAMDSAQVGLGRFVLPHAVSQAVYEIVASDIVMASATESERALNENDTERWIAFERRHLRLPSIDSGDDGLRLWQGNTGSPMGMFRIDAIAKGIGADRERLKELLRAEGNVSQVVLSPNCPDT